MENWNINSQDKQQDRKISEDKTSDSDVLGCVHQFIPIEIQPSPWIQLLPSYLSYLIICDIKPHVKRVLWFAVIFSFYQYMYYLVIKKNYKSINQFIPHCISHNHNQQCINHRDLNHSVFVSLSGELLLFWLCTVLSLPLGHVTSSANGQQYTSKINKDFLIKLFVRLDRAACT